MRILFCHGLGSSINNRISQQLVALFKDSSHHVVPVIYPKAAPTWNVSQWLRAVEAEVDRSTDTVLVAQSAGAHPALNAVINKPHNVKGLFLVSPGYDVDFGYVDKVIPGAMEKMMRGETIVHPATRNGEEISVDLQSFKHYRETCVSTRDGTLPIHCPVSLVHGTADPLVPYGNSIRLLMRVGSKDIHMNTVPQGSHFLSLDDEEVRSAFVKFAQHVGLFPIDAEQKRAKM